MEPKIKAGPLWFGSGFHFALEQMYLPKNPYGTAAEAFNEYTRLTKKYNWKSLPPDWEDLQVLGLEMCNYYEFDWLQKRAYLPTYIFNGQPQVEVGFKIELPVEVEGYDAVIFSGTLDRISYDEESDSLWIVEYKTAKAFATQHFMNDAQISAYSWAASLIYDKPVLGVIYQQHLKASPKPPRILKSGELSKAINQRTTYSLFKEALQNQYPDKEVPEEYTPVLENLAQQESEDKDRFVRRDYCYRNKHFQEAESVKLLLEVEDMLNPDLPLYPNPTRDCSWKCPFLSACISMDDGSSFEDELQANFRQRPASYDPWRKYL